MPLIPRLGRGGWGGYNSRKPRASQGRVGGILELSLGDAQSALRRCVPAPDDRRPRQEGQDRRCRASGQGCVLPCKAGVRAPAEARVGALVETRALH